MTVVEFRNVSKSFALHGSQLLFRQRLGRLMKARRRERFWALRDISYSLSNGESLGIIGHNGAGKTTVLNLISGLCRPTCGSVQVSGRVAALLDLGAGFHPDLTGVENVWVNAGLLGLTAKQTARRFEEIVEFADIGEFINEPLRTYSAGMTMRLAFSVAMHVDPDVLIVDEVLGVGDQQFVEKCTAKVMSFKNAGKTMICVSHSLPMIHSLCDRTLWLDHGTVARCGPTGDVIAEYEGATRRVT